MEAHKEITEALNLGHQRCCEKIRALMINFKENKAEIRRLQREKNMYYSFKQRIDKYEYRKN